MNLQSFYHNLWCILNSKHIQSFLQLVLIYLSGRFCLDKLWVDPVGRGDHLWHCFDFFVLLTGDPKQYVLLTVLRLKELPERYLSSWDSQISKQVSCVYAIIYIQSEETHLCNQELCPRTHSKSQHHPRDPWESNTIYPWKEDQDLSLAQLSVNWAHTTYKPQLHCTNSLII